MNQAIIPAARTDELVRLIKIEHAAGAWFRSLGMDAVADDDPGSIEQLTTYAEDNRASSRSTAWIGRSGISCSTSSMAPRISR